MLIIIGIIMLFTLLSIEGQLKKGINQNEEIIDLLKELNEKSSN